MSPRAYKASVSEHYAGEGALGARPVEGDRVRMPFERSAADRHKRTAGDVIEVPDDVAQNSWQSPHVTLCARKSSTIRFVRYIPDDKVYNRTETGP